MQRHDDRVFTGLEDVVRSPLMSYHHDEINDAMISSLLLSILSDRTKEILIKCNSICPSIHSDGKYLFDPIEKRISEKMNKKVQQLRKKKTLIFLVQFGIVTEEDERTTDNWLCR